MMIAANAAAMSEDELTDLTYAFQAADMDGGGAIDAAEFTMMLSVMGCEISPAQGERVIQEAEQGFAAWMKMADAENVKKCTAVWDEFDADNYDIDEEATTVVEEVQMRRPKIIV